MENNGSNQTLSTLLNSRPTQRGQLIMQAIIISLFVHILILGTMYIVTAPPPVAADEAELPTVDEIELSLETPEQLAAEQEMAQANMSEEVRDLLAKAGTARTKEYVNYSGKSQAQINQEVANDLASFERDQFNQLKSTHQDYSVPQPSGDKNKKPQSAENIEEYRNRSAKSYSGNVSAEYALSGRDANYNPRPTYLCKTAGKIIINITVDANGTVTNATINSASSSDECLRSQSIEYAKKWRFDTKNATPKQSGTITFTFAAQ